MASTFNIIRNLFSLISPDIRQNLIAVSKPFYKMLLGNVNHIVFSPTFRCNYNCPYCLINTKVEYAKKYSKSSEHDYSEWIKVLNGFTRSLIYISGGEPLIFPGLADLIKEVSKKHLIASLSTNLSLNTNELIGIDRKDIASIAASYHPHMIDKDSFAEKVRILKQKWFFVKVSIVAHPDLLDSIDNLKIYFKEKLGVEFLVEPYLDPTYDYSNEGKKMLTKYVKTDRKIGYDFNDSKAKKCCAGSSYFMIIPNGDVYSCYAGFYNDTSLLHKRYYKNGNFYLGNLFDGTFRKMPGYKVCSIPCSEACDISLSNVRPI